MRELWQLRYATWGVCGFLWLGSGCRGPERAPHQPITGVDRPRETSGPTERSGPAGSSGLVGNTETWATGSAGSQASGADGPVTGRAVRGLGWLETFAREVAAQGTGEVAVFPAMRRSDTGKVSFDGLGEYLMDETAAELSSHGVRSVCGPALESRLRKVRRTSTDYTDEWSAYQLAEQMGFRRVICGSFRLTHTGRRLDQQEWLDIDWRCHDLDTDLDVARARPKVDRNPEFQELMVWAEQPATWQWNADRGSVSAEIAALTDQTLDALLAKVKVLSNDGEKLRVAVLPTVLPSSRDVSRRALEFAVNFQRAYAEVAGRLPSEEVLQQPATVGSAQYPTLAAALDEYRVMRDELERSSAGRLGDWVARQLVDRVQVREGFETVLAPWDRDRDALLFVLQDEVSRVTTEGSVDEDSLPFLQARGSQAVLRSEFEDLPGGELALTLTFLTFEPSGRWTESRPVAGERLGEVRNALGAIRGGQR